MANGNSHPVSTVRIIPPATNPLPGPQRFPIPRPFVATGTFEATLVRIGSVRLVAQRREVDNSVTTILDTTELVTFPTATTWSASFDVALPTDIEITMIVSGQNNQGPATYVTSFIWRSPRVNFTGIGINADFTAGKLTGTLIDAQNFDAVPSSSSTPLLKVLQPSGTFTIYGVPLSTSTTTTITPKDGAAATIATPDPIVFRYEQDSTRPNALVPSQVSAAVNAVSITFDEEMGPSAYDNVSQHYQLKDGTTTFAIAVSKSETNANQAIVKPTAHQLVVGTTYTLVLKAPAIFSSVQNALDDADDPRDFHVVN